MAPDHGSGASHDDLNRRDIAAAIASVARWCRDLDLAEEAVHEAVVRGLQAWATSSPPGSRVAWLVTTARRIVLDMLRHRAIERRAEPELLAATVSAADAADAGLIDDMLRMLLACCDERLPAEAQTVLALRYVAGLSVVEIARAFMCSDSALEQRLVRAKRTARLLGARFEPPDLERLNDRLPAVHLTLYLIFNEGYAVTAGVDLLRNDACHEAIFLTGMLRRLVPDSNETAGLLALMKLQASRADARVGSDGALLRLHEQDRSRWNNGAVDEAFRLLAATRATGRPPGPYELEAAIALHHAHATSVDDTDWPEVVRLYDCLLVMRSDPVTRLNRAVAISRAEGPAAALPLVDALGTECPRYALVAAVRADLLFRLGRFAEAIESFEDAWRQTHNRVERCFLEARLAECRHAHRATDARGEAP